MENKNYIEMNYDDYKKIESKIDSMKTEEELIETHKKLIGKTCKSHYYEIKDCGVEFIEEFLSRDWGRTIDYQYSSGAKKFIQSKYLSDYFKNSIKELLSTQELSDEVKNALNSDKLINDMSEEEIKSICSSINDFYKNSEQKIVNIAGSIKSFLYKLNGKGVMAYIKNNVSNDSLAIDILRTSGLCDRASYYSGRGVNRGDLNERNLVAIFRKLLKIDQNYAIEFVEMVKQMETLGATEFINSFKKFAKNGFKLENFKVDDDNISLDGLYGQQRDAVAFISLLDTMSRGSDSAYQTSASEEMKDEFISKIIYTLREINPNFTYKGRQFRDYYDYWNWDYDDYYNKKRFR